MRLKKVLKILGTLKDYPDVKIKGFTRIEDEIKEGYIYFSFEELTLKKYQQLKGRGALYIIGECEFLHNDYIEVLSVKKSYQQLLYFTNSYKLKNKKIIGVTGTNGKTTVSTLIYNYLSNKTKTIYFGSNGIYSKRYKNSHNTTPSMEEFFKNLSNEKYVIIELSSISYYEYRLFNININYLILTNIYEDHLDYHKTYLDYYYTKLLILSSNPNSTLIVSDEIKDMKILRLNKHTYTYGIKDIDYNINVYKNHENIVEISTDKESYTIKTNLECNYNIYNLLASIKLLYILGYKLEDISSFYNKDITISGRFNKYTFKGKPIIVDYPHTASAYSTLFKDLKENYKGNWLILFGAGGNRQESKRKEYATIVSEYGSFAVITNDNPRYEEESKITDEIVKYLTIPYVVIHDRVLAIKKAISLIDEYDLILILGKGKEEYIEINGEYIPHSDIKTIEELIK